MGMSSGSKRRVGAGAITLAAGVSSMVFGLLGTASADDHTGGECVPSAAVPASFSEWAPSGAYTAWQHDSTPPADPDGASGATDPANLRMVGPSPQTEKHVTQVHVPAVPATPGQWWNWSPNRDQEPFAGPPSFPTDPRGVWQGPRTEDGPPGTGTFQPGNGGNASWFHREAGTPGTDAVPEVSHTDYRWPILQRTYTPAVDAVVCPPDVAGNQEDRRDRTRVDCGNDTVVTYEEVRTRPQGAVSWSAWSTVPGSESSRPATDRECPTGTPNTPGTPGTPGTDVKGSDKGDDGDKADRSPGSDAEPEVLGVSRSVPAPAAAAAPVAAPTAVDAGLSLVETGQDSSRLWVLLGGAVALFGLALGIVPAPARGKRSV